MPDGVLHRLVNIVIACAYYAGFHSSSWQATPGKKAFGIKVTDYEGGRIGLGRAIGRYFATWLSFIVLGVGFLMAAFTQKRQALHDMICSTLVVNRGALPNEVVAGGGAMPITAGVWAFIVLPFLGGILAGISIPAYQDYTVRAKVAEVIGASRPLKEDVERAISEKRSWTTGEVPIGSKYASGAQVTPQGDIVVNVNDDISRGGRIRFTPSTTSGGVQWKCTGEDIQKKLLPAVCRE
jgi:Tfp pilus assembly major pilin PilA